MCAHIYHTVSSVSTSYVQNIILNSVSKYIKNRHFHHLETVFWAPGPKTWFFLDMRFSQAVSLYFALTSQQKSEKSFSKTPFLVHFRHFWPKISPTGFFLKKRFPSLFYPYNTLTPCTKSEKSLEPFPVTLCYRQTNIWNKENSQCKLNYINRISQS